MTKLDFDSYAFPEKPEVIIGFVAPVGVPIRLFEPLLSSELDSRGYKSVSIRLSEFIREADPDGKIPTDEGFERYDGLMTLGNAVRRSSNRNDVLALFAAARMSSERPKNEPRHLTRTAFLISQLKHPDEVFRLRRIYGDSFVLIGLYCPRNIREQHLMRRGLTAEEARRLIDRDEDERKEFGQRVSDTYHLADVFIEVVSTDGEQGLRVKGDIKRLCDLFFGTDLVTPTREEYGMFVASASALRSASLARQVGAAILTPHGEVIACGANEVPSPYGGLYWGDETGSDKRPFDARDPAVGVDFSDGMKVRIIREVLEAVDSSFGELGRAESRERVREVVKMLKPTRLASLTEFSRAVHAEMDAITTAARLGSSVDGAILYATTFPCHGCAKHIVAAGISRVVFIEPYPKSLALEMHRDSVHLEGSERAEGGGEWVGKEPPNDDKVLFKPFVGVSPRRFQDVFSRLTSEGRKAEVKDPASGELVRAGLGSRLPASPFSYTVREDLAAGELKRIKEETDAFRREA